MNNKTTTAHTDHACFPPTGGEGADRAVNRTLCLEQAELALLKLKHYTTLAVWRSMLCEARRKQNWQICHAVMAIRKETCLSKPTILKAQKDLVGLGYATILSGGCGSRQPITFGLIPSPASHSSLSNQSPCVSRAMHVRNGGIGWGAVRNHAETKAEVVRSDKADYVRKVITTPAVADYLKTHHETRGIKRNKPGKKEDDRTAVAGQKLVALFANFLQFVLR